MFRQLLALLLTLSIVLTGICYQTGLVKKSYANSISQMTSGIETISHSENQMSCCSMELSHATTEIFFREDKDQLVKNPTLELPRVFTFLQTRWNFREKYSHRLSAALGVFPGDSLALVATVVKRE